MLKMVYVFFHTVIKILDKSFADIYQYISSYFCALVFSPVATFGQQQTQIKQKQLKSGRIKTLHKTSRFPFKNKKYDVVPWLWDT